MAVSVPHGKIHHTAKFGSRTNTVDQVNYVLESYYMIYSIANRYC